MKIYIVAWEYDTGGGFNWFYKKEAALTAFDDEKKNCNDWVEVNWQVAYFEYKSKSEIPEEIDNEIEINLETLFNSATMKYKAIKEYPETHQKGYISIEKPLIQNMVEKVEDFGIQIANDGRIWICINGISVLRFKPINEYQLKKGD